MLAYVTLGSNDKDKAVEFYDAVMGELGGQRVFANDRLQFYGTGPGQPMIAIGGPYDGEAASAGNGVMPALGCKDALEMGGTCEGEPGQRLPNFYGAYFRDPDGNKLCVCKLG